MNRSLILALALALPAATVLSAADATAQQRGQRFFARADTNKDGAVDQQEATALRAKLFDRLDQNKDGTVTQEEAETAKRRVREKATGSGQTAFQRADADKDGKVTVWEFRGRRYY